MDNFINIHGFGTIIAVEEKQGQKKPYCKIEIEFADQRGGKGVLKAICFELAKQGSQVFFTGRGQPSNGYINWTLQTYPAATVPQVAIADEDVPW